MDEQFLQAAQAGDAAARLGDWEAASAAYERALALRPDNAPILFKLGLVRLGQGRYAEGWKLYEARTAFDRLLVKGLGIPEWSGEDLAGRSLLVWPEQGLGDEIQMARYVAPLAALGAEVVLACSPPLARLFAQLPARVAPLENELVLPRTDLFVRTFSLPHRFGSTLESLSPAPYLRAPETPRTGGVGVVWQGDPSHPNDAVRSLPSRAVLEPLAEVAELVDLLPPRGDFLDTAARVRALDLVISVDTAMVHLCGALGVPCWVMLPHERVDWRWAPRTATSPWYGSLRLYRQTAPGDWAGVVERMAQDLSAGS